MSNEATNRVLLGRGIGAIHMILHIPRTRSNVHKALVLLMRGHWFSLREVSYATLRTRERQRVRIQFQEP